MKTKSPNTYKVPKWKRKNHNPPLAIYHAFQQRFTEVQKRLGNLHAAGYDAIQLSPAQKSMRGQAWWKRYQPVSYSEITGLGTAHDLRSLCAEARKYNIRIIADVVFTHMAPIATRDEWRRNTRNKTALIGDRLHALFGPELKRSDFAAPFHLERANALNKWYDGEHTNLKCTENVIRTHKRHLKLLNDLGVTGFKISAADILLPSQLKFYSDYTRDMNAESWVYAEIQGSSSAPCNIARTDIPTAELLNRCFRKKDLRAFARHSSSQTGVRYVRSHHSVHRSSSMFRMKRALDSNCLLAWCFLLSMSSGSVLVYPSEAETWLIKAAVSFRRLMAEAGSSSHKIFTTEDISSRKGGATSIVARGKLGFSVTNLSTEWFHAPNADISKSELDGTYIEQVYNFTVKVRNGRVISWGERKRPGVHIGPQTNLFFIHQDLLKSSAGPV